MWVVKFHDDFAPEFKLLAQPVQDAILTYAQVLAQEGPSLGRPHVGTLKNPSAPKMKELRPTVDKVEWRVAFAFDTAQEAILLAAVAKGGTNEELIYKRLLKTANQRLKAHEKTLSKPSPKPKKPSKRT